MNVKKVVEMVGEDRGFTNFESEELLYKTIENEKLRNLIDTLSSTLKLQSNVIQKLISGRDLQASTAKVLGLLKKRLKLDEIAVLLYEEEKGGLTVFAAAGLTPRKKKAVFHPGEGISGRAFLFKKTLFTERAGSDPRFMNWLQNTSEYRNKSFIAIPLISGDTVLGVLTATADTLPTIYLNILQVFASTLSPLLHLLKTKLQQEQQYYNMIQKLIDVSEALNPVFRGHSHRVNRYSLYLADKLKMSEEKKKIIHHGSRLHDVGKLAMMDIVKKHGKLTKREYEILKLHPVLGEQFVRDFDFLVPAIPMIKFHHERYDGTGYPGMYMGEEIPLNARIVSVADVYDAITGSRHYRKPLSFEKAVKELSNSSGSQLDPYLVEVFLSDLNELKDFTEELKQKRFPY